MYSKSLSRTLLVVLLTLTTGIPVGALPLPTNMDLIVATLESTIDRALGEMDSPLAAPEALLIRPQTRHAANWLVDHLLTERLLARGFSVTLDSTNAPADGLRLGYRILDLGVTGQATLMGGQIERQSQATLTFSLTRGEELRWQREFQQRLQDRIPKDRVDLLENDAYPFAKTQLETQTWGKFVEPVIVSTVLGGLIYLFFSNR